MRASLFLPLLASLSGLASASAVETRDKEARKKLGFANVQLAAEDLEVEGALRFQRENVHFVVLPYLKQVSEPQDTASTTNATDATVLSARGVLDVLLRRYTTCPAGYGLCTGSNKCCSSSGGCCNGATTFCAARSTDTCCQYGTCPGDKDCCGTRGCMPKGAECCVGGTYCTGGNLCYYVPTAGDVCCTDDTCLVYVSNSRTVTRSASYTATSAYETSWTATRTADDDETPITTSSGPTATSSGRGSAAETGFYTFTISDAYSSYFWTTYTRGDTVLASIDVTYMTTYYTTSFYATDAWDATDSFYLASATASFSTPSAATALQSSYSDFPIRTITSGDSTSTTTRRPANNTIDGSTSSSSTAALHLDDRILGVYAAASALVGVLMVYL